MTIYRKILHQRHNQINISSQDLSIGLTIRTLVKVYLFSVTCDGEVTTKASIGDLRWCSHHKGQYR